MNAYRPEPAVPATSAAPKLWRPWMTRLAYVLAVAASPAAALASMWVAGHRDTCPAWYVALVVCLMVQALGGAIVCALKYVETGTHHTPRMYLQCAWWCVGCVVMAYRAALKVGAWVVGGSVE